MAHGVCVQRIHTAPFELTGEKLSNHFQTVHEIVFHDRCTQTVFIE